MTTTTAITRFYVARTIGGRVHPALGPFVAHDAARTCVAAVQARERTLGLSGAQALEVVPVTGLDHELPEGLLNAYFPRGLLDPHRVAADVVHYWPGSAGDGAVRWIACAEAAPTLRLGRGQFLCTGHALTLELVRAQVAAQDPLLAQTVTTWTAAPTPPSVASDGIPRTVRLRANRLDIGSLVVAEGQDIGRAQPIVYIRHVRDAEDLYMLVQYRLGLDREVQECPQHSFVTVLDEDPAADSVVAERPADWSRTPTSALTDLAAVPAAAQLALFRPQQPPPNPPTPHQPREATANGWSQAAAQYDRP